MLKILEYVDIKNYSTFKIGGQFRYFTIISSISDLKSFHTTIQNDARFKNIPIFILGGGSNIVFSDGLLDIFALKNEIKGFEIISETDEYVDIKVGAGEIWDDIVTKTVDMNLSGLEALSAIPGTVGAGPIQNIGAYGSEVKDTLLEVEVFDIKSGNISNISNKDCKFSYRDSIFKNEAKGKYTITAVIYRLAKEFKNNSSEKALERGIRPLEVQPLGTVEVGPLISKVLSYPGVMKYFENKKIENPTIRQIREAIINIRSEKLPNPKEIPNVGSFFKNPIVENNIADGIKIKYPEVKFFPVDEKYTKIPAGWLIENAGLKGKSFGSISIYNKNALVLINNGNASKDDLLKAKNEIIKIVEEKFRIILEQEPEVI
jgi:UDP-N-acetylmuramate dehydrogenase